MKCKNMSVVLIVAFYSLCYLPITSNNIFTQTNSEWLLHPIAEDANAIAIEGDTIWVGTKDGLFQFERTNSITLNDFYNTTNSGLPANEINAIVIDNNTDKWIATFKGLVRYDGINWEVYRTDNSPLSSNCIEVMVKDSNGNIWIGVNNYPGWRLVKYDGTDWTFYDYERSTEIFWSGIATMAIDDSGNVWIGSGGEEMWKSDGLVKFDGDTTWTVYNPENFGLPRRTVLALAIDDSNNIWLGCPYIGLIKCDGDTTWVQYDFFDYIHAIAIDESGTLWIGADHEFVKYDGGNDWTYFDEMNPPFPEYVCTAIAIDNSGNKWLGGCHCENFNRLDWWLMAYNEGGVILDIGMDDTESSTVKEFILKQNYPNPFNPMTTISYTLPKSSTVSFTIYNLAGQKIETLVSEAQSAGEHEVKWNAGQLPSGVYVCRMQAGEFVQTRKLVLLK